MSTATYKHSAQAHGEMVSYAWRLTGSRDQAEEVVQAAYADWLKPQPSSYWKNQRLICDA
ncbi:hypothetical protein [Gluconobacter sp. P1C6_b]|uniref:hypothetical protein n=1 Tax=Gluconobacter sp. P1C6_b TaxID=2762619 RepID=UPI001C0590D0|nr:hypothetical protein [Gluconobacter sp. P1C6_b]